MSRDLKIFAAIILVLGLMGIGFIYEAMMWTQCLKDNPWWYCLRILG